MKTRVLHVTDVLAPASGVASVIMSLAEHSEYIQDAAVYSDIDPAMAARFEKRGGKVYKVSDVRTGFGRLFKRDISALYDKNRYTAVHGHTLNSAYIYMKEAKKKGIPIRIIHAHSSISADTPAKRLRNDFLQRGLTQWGTRFAAVSDAAAQNAFKKNSDKAVIIRNGIDAEKFKYDEQVREAAREELGLSGDTLCVGNVARFSPEKNHGFLLSVAAKLPNAVFLLAGDGPLLEECKRNAPPNVRFLGARTDAERLYQAFDAFMLPSLFEGFPLTAIEAQCAGLPCVFSDRITREVKCLDHVMFLPVDDAEKWAKSIAEMVFVERNNGFEKVITAGLDVKSMIEFFDRLYLMK